jgi:hypothetical protein
MCEETNLYRNQRHTNPRVQMRFIVKRGSGEGMFYFLSSFKELVRDEFSISQELSKFTKKTLLINCCGCENGFPARTFLRIITEAEMPSQSIDLRAGAVFSPSKTREAFSELYRILLSSQF